MQVAGLEPMPMPELLSDAEILSSIKSTMTRKQTMSLPLHLLKGNPSLDALENALRAESMLFPRAQSMRRRMVPGAQVRGRHATCQSPNVACAGARCHQRHRDGGQGPAGMQSNPWRHAPLRSLCYHCRMAVLTLSLLGCMPRLEKRCSKHFGACLALRFGVHAGHAGVRLGRDQP